MLGLLERRRVLLAERSGDVWQVYARQEEAVQALRSARLSQSPPQPHPSAALQLFSRELSDSSGAREFIVASYAAFYRRYMALPARHRHHYGHCSTQAHTTLRHTQPIGSGSAPGHACRLTARACVLCVLPCLAPLVAEVVTPTQRQATASPRAAHIAMRASAQSSLAHLPSVAVAASSCAVLSVLFVLCWAACHLYLDVEFPRQHNAHISCEQHEEQVRATHIRVELCCRIP